MSDEPVRIEVNGETIEARKAEMVIQATDRAGIYVPRFCYHEKLSVAANCRMCLVEVEKAPKPLPACATPVADGMKVRTRSPKAISAQRASMEFLLINHPLDCPICDQGGECELQDLAMGFGRGISRFTEKKRSVEDEDIGPLISTDMTRCIHCTRCVRFGQEIAGIQEFGTVGRSEHMEIRTFVERSVDHELSGNVIDLCPVGALNSRPFRFRARSWEMVQRPMVSPHDCVGSNLYGHVKQGKLLRVVPRQNEAINETWIADRDRFSYAGVYASDRLAAPMLKRDGEWQTVGWELAFDHLAKALPAVLGGDGRQLAALASPCSTLEELYLLQKLARALGSSNIDHRLRMQDFRAPEEDPPYPSLGLGIAELERQHALLVAGSNMRREAPILAHRLRKAALAGGQVGFLNPPGFEYLFPVAQQLDTDGAGFVRALASVVKAAAEATGRRLPEAIARACEVLRPDDASAALARMLREGERSAILLGALALRHPAFTELRALAATLAELTGSTFGQVTEGANAAGAWLAGAVPHREPGGAKAGSPGLDLGQMLRDPPKAFLLLNLEPEADCLNGQAAMDALGEAELVVALTPFANEAARVYADVLLPIGTFAETAGTFVNVEGRWQSFSAVANLLGEARPGWKVLRVLANRLELPGFEYESSEDIRDALEAAVGDVRPQPVQARHGRVAVSGDGARVIDVPMYAVDAIVRRSAPLQHARDGRLEPSVY